jgi:hypothetical protein
MTKEAEKATRYAEEPEKFQSAGASSGLRKGFIIII